MKKLSLKGSCLCGSIKFSTEGNHRNIINCHCSYCMKTHGHYGAYTTIDEQNIKFIKKNNLKWFRSSKRAKRGFCGKCGASIFFKVLKTKKICIAAGMFDKPVKLKTIMNIFTKNKLDYYQIPNNGLKFNRYPQMPKKNVKR